MKLPEKIELRMTLHGHGAKGMSIYGYADNQGLGVHVKAVRESRRHPMVETWQYAWLPDQDFPTYRELREAVAKLTDEQIAAEKVNYPRMEPIKPIGERKYQNKCRLCPSGSGKDGTFAFTVYTTPLDFEFGELCADHAHVADDTRGFLAALEAAAAERKAQRKTLGLPE